MTDIPAAAYVSLGQYDTPAIRDGAVQYVKCATCGAEPGEPCVILLYQAARGQPLSGFAHVSRRMEYHGWVDIYGPATRTWEFDAQIHERKMKERQSVVHIFGEPEKMRPCSRPRRHCPSCQQCECGALFADHAGVRSEPKKSNTDVDDLLG